MVMVNKYTMSGDLVFKSSVLIVPDPNDHGRNAFQKSSGNYVSWTKFSMCLEKS